LAYLYAIVVILMAIFQRHFLYFPSHDSNRGELVPWSNNAQVIAYSRIVESPKIVWLVLHGNAGQASMRGYVLECLPEGDSVYVMEYPGYGQRTGTPSRKSMNAAASEAYAMLRASYPNTPICVLGESIGSGPASFLATLPTPPTRIVLVVPFDSLPSLAQEHVPFLPVQWLLMDRWNNIEALKSYTGRVDIYGALQDRVIPISHARNLAASLPHSYLHEIEGGHNDWSRNIGLIEGL